MDKAITQVNSDVQIVSIDKLVINKEASHGNGWQVIILLGT